MMIVTGLGYVQLILALIRRNIQCTDGVLDRFSLEMLAYSWLQTAGALRSLQCSQIIYGATFDLAALLGTSNPILCILSSCINLHFCFSSVMNDLS
jgi:hypothetical protein